MKRRRRVRTRRGRRRWRLRGRGVLCKDWIWVVVSRYRFRSREKERSRGRWRSRQLVVGRKRGRRGSVFDSSLVLSVARYTSRNPSREPCCSSPTPQRSLLPPSRPNQPHHPPLPPLPLDAAIPFRSSLHPPAATLAYSLLHQTSPLLAATRHLELSRDGQRGGHRVEARSRAAGTTARGSRRG